MPLLAVELHDLDCADGCVGEVAEGRERRYLVARVSETVGREVVGDEGVKLQSSAAGKGEWLLQLCTLVKFAEVPYVYRLYLYPVTPPVSTFRLAVCNTDLNIVLLSVSYGSAL